MVTQSFCVTDAMVAFSLQLAGVVVWELVNETGKIPARRSRLWYILCHDKVGAKCL